MGRPVSMKLGDKFTVLTVISRVDSKMKGQTRWLCSCECGQTKEVYATHLRSGNVKTCGCSGKSLQAASIRRHGAVGTPEHNTWNMMNARCYTPSATDFHKYGGRGIVVCERWRWPDGFLNFLADMGERPRGLTLDRIDNDGGYEPNNCRWATGRQQQNNTRKTRFVSYKGETLPLADWARRIGVSGGVLWNRLYRYKWPVAEALGFEPHA